MPTPHRAGPLLALLLCLACGPAGRIGSSANERAAPADAASPPDGQTPTPPVTPADLRSVADWERRFLGEWGREHTRDFLPWSNSSDSWDFYNLAYGIDANTAMYRATGRTQYLDRALLYATNLMATARVSSTLPRSPFHDGYLGWASERSEPPGQEVPLYESYCWRYVTRLLRVLRQTPALYADSAYRAQYERLLAFSEKHVFEKWFQRGASDFIYRNRTHMAAHWAFIALDLGLITPDAGRRTRYQEVFNRIHHDLREQLQPNPDHPAAWFWSDQWGSHAQPGQDVAHANGVVALVVEAHDAGIAWTDADIRRFVATLDTVLWPAARTYAEYVDGSGTGSGWFNDGLMKLGRYDLRLQRRLESHAVGQTGPFFANGALNASRLTQQAARVDTTHTGP